MPGGLPSFGAVAVDGRVLAFCAAVVLGTGLLFGAVPAINAARTDLSRTLASRSGGASAPGRIDARDVFVAAQLALCVVLLVGAGLLGRSLVALERVNPGFDAPGLLTAQLRLPPNKYRTPEAIAQCGARHRRGPRCSRRAVGGAGSVDAAHGQLRLHLVPDGGRERRLGAATGDAAERHRRRLLRDDADPRHRRPGFRTGRPLDVATGRDREPVVRAA